MGAGGRPTIFCDDLIASILTRMMDGESLRSICRADSMPAMATVVRWLSEKPEFKAQYEKASELRALNIFEEILEIADDSSQDVMLDKEGNERVNAEFVARSRLRVDARKWFVSKMMPKLYGDKIMQDHTSSDGSMTPKELDVSKISTAALKEFYAAKNATKPE